VWQIRCVFISVEPRFDEGQVAEILRRSAELQLAADPSTSLPGMSLAELQRVAAEVGLDPELVARAAREIQAAAVEALDSGSGSSVLLDQTLAGSLTEEQWEDVVTELRRLSGKQGKETVSGASSVWVGNWEVANITLTVSKRGNSSRLQMLLDMSGGRVLFWMGGSLATLALTAVLGGLMSHSGHGPAATAATVFGVAGGGLLTARYLLSRWMRATHSKATMLFRSIAGRFDSGAAVPISSSPSLPLVQAPDESVSVEG
jgi:hypothetical protein